MDFRCSVCNTIIAKEDRRHKPPKLSAANGATLGLRPGEAPRIKCTCGRTTILLKGRS